MRRSLEWLLRAVLVVGLLACGDDPTGVRPEGPGDLAGNYNGIWRYEAMSQGAPHDWECEGDLRILYHTGDEVAGSFHTRDSSVCRETWARYSGNLKGKLVQLDFEVPCANIADAERRPVGRLTGALDYDRVDVEGSISLICPDGSSLRETLAFQGRRGPIEPGGKPSAGGTSMSRLSTPP